MEKLKRTYVPSDTLYWKEDGTKKHVVSLKVTEEFIRTSTREKFLDVLVYVLSNDEAMMDQLIERLENHGDL